MVVPRSKKELSLMAGAGKIGASALKKVIESAKTGISLIELDKIAEREIQRLGGESNFKLEEGYFWSTCLTLNDEVVHGIPRDIQLKAGDVLGIDTGAVYKGWHSDCAWSVVVGREDKKFEEEERFLRVGEEALWNGIGAAVEGNRLGDISSIIQETVERGRYNVVRSFVGHGIGREMHAEPEVPGYGKKETCLLLKEGMTLAIEVIYTQGSYDLVQDLDRWTVKTKDGLLGGLFEMTVAVGKKNAQVLTDWRKG